MVTRRVRFPPTFLNFKNNKMETVKFKRIHEKQWKTLKHLGKPFTDMEEAIKFVRHNKAGWGLELKQHFGNGGSNIQWDNF